VNIKIINMLPYTMIESIIKAKILSFKPAKSYCMVTF